MRSGNIDGHNKMSSSFCKYIYITVEQNSYYFGFPTEHFLVFKELNTVCYDR